MALTNKPGFKDKRTKDKIDLHLRDINDEITEKDIENVQTDVTVNIDDSETSDADAAREADKMLEKKKKQEKDKGDENNSNSVETPWNMLD